MISVRFDRVCVFQRRLTCHQAQANIKVSGPMEKVINRGWNAGWMKRSGLQASHEFWSWKLHQRMSSDFDFHSIGDKGRPQKVPISGAAGGRDGPYWEYGPISRTYVHKACSFVDIDNVCKVQFFVLYFTRQS